MLDTKGLMCEKIFNEVIDIGNDIKEDDDIIQELREQWAVEGKGMSVVIEITLKPSSVKNPNPRPIYTGCFTMINGYPKKVPVPVNPHVRIRTDFMCLRYILRGYRYYKAPNGRIQVKYGFKRAYGEERLLKEVRDDVHSLSDTALVDKVITLLEGRIFPIFRRKWKKHWVMQDS